MGRWAAVLAALVLAGCSETGGGYYPPPPGGQGYIASDGSFVHHERKRQQNPAVYRQASQQARMQADVQNCLRPGAMTGGTWSNFNTGYCEAVLARAGRHDAVYAAQQQRRMNEQAEQMRQMQQQQEEILRRQQKVQQCLQYGGALCY